MSFTDQYNALKKKREEEEKKKKKTSSFDEEYEKLKAETSEEKFTLPSPVAKDKIFHSSFNLPQKKEEKRTWFDSGAFDDGYQFGDVTKTVFGSVMDVRENLAAGILGIGEKVVDAGAYVAGGVGGLFGADEFKEKTKEFIAKDLYDEKKIAKKIIGIDSWAQKKQLGVNSGDSVFGDKADALVESGGQLLGTMGLQAVGVPWFVTSGVTSFGGEAENAFNQGASYGEAGLSAAISAGSEILTEKLFGGSGLGEKGLINLEPLTKGISSKLFKALADYGVDMAAEGAEEVFSQVASNLGSALYKEENLQDLLFSEEAVDGYIESFIGGAALGGFANVGKVSNSIKTGKDYRTDLTENEQKVFDKVYEDEVAEAEKNGKLTEKEKAAIYDRVMEDMEKGYISTDTIEEVLGDKSSFDALSKEAEEFKTLYETEGGKLSEKQRDRLAELKEKNRVNPYEDAVKKSKDQFSQSVFEQVKGDRLSESYRQKAYRGQSFQADVSQYDKKQQEVIQKAIDSGFLNNTRRTHEFVDMVAKISADKGVLFDFTNNEKLKTSGFAVDGKFVNGYFDKKSNSIGVNIDSSKSLNSVVGHEITHVLEGTEVYDALKKTLFDYAKAKGDYQGRYDSLSKMYENIKDAEVEAELAADLVGDYLFTDSEFIHRLSTENKNLFQKIWDEVKYLCKVATAGSKEARELEKVKRAFEKAYRGEGKAKGTKYSLSDSDGKKLTKQQQEYFKDSKMRDEQGNLKVMYHGSQDAGFHVFDGKFSDDDISFFFVDRNDVAASYSGTTETYEAKAFKTAEDANKFFADIGKTEYVVIENDGQYTLLDDGDEVATSDDLAEIYDEWRDWEGVGYGDANYKVYLNLKNPLEVDAKGRPWNKIDAEFSQEVYDKYNSLTKEEKEALTDLAEWEDFRIFNSEIQEARGDALASAYEKMGEDCNIYDLFSVAAENFSEEAMRENSRKYLKTRDYAQRAKEQGYDGVIFKNIIDNGGYSNGDEGASTVAIAFESNQIKSVANEKPTGDKDIRYSVSEEQNQKGLTNEQEVEYSISYDTKYADSAIALNKKTGNVSDEVMQAQKLMRERVAERLRKMVEKGVALPKDKEGNTFFSNSSYGGSEENTTICPRSLAPEAFMDAVSEMVGRPLTVEEQIYIGQDLMGRMGSSEELRGQSFLAQCVYCYVAADRMAQREYLGEYIKQRDSFLQKVTDDIDVSQLRKDHRALAAWFKDKKQAKPELSQIGELYREFLDGRKPTGATYKRVKMWLDAARNGKPMIDGNHLANIDKLVGDISAFGDELKPQIQDAWKYAQSASWAKKRVGYVAYNGHIQKWDQKRINDLNKHYGLRLYSFSDFHPAFVLENMQMVSDAAVQGLKMLGYTKDTDFVEIFAPTGMNINVSTFGFEKNGGVYEDNRMGTEWAKAQELRAKYPNVGITFVATNDAITKWALKQDWIDVVIPYHMVKTGETIAQHFGFTNYTKESADQKTSAWKQKGWSTGHDSSIAPPVHNNDLATYLAALNANGLEPRFKRFLDDPETRPYYMKLVNECRQSASQSKPVQPIFNEEAIERTLAKLEANGYYQPIGGSVERMYEIAAEVAEDMTKQLAPAMSISEEGQTHKEYGNWNVYGEDVRYNEIAPVAETKNAADVAKNDTSTIPADARELFPDDLAPMDDFDERFDSITDEDAPPEMEAPYQAPQKETVSDPFKDRDWYEIGNRKVKAYMYENPEVKPFFQAEAQNLLGELNDTIRGERWYNDELHYESGGEKGFGGVSRMTSQSMEELLDSWHMSYADIEKGLKAIIEDHGAENIAAAKKLEFMLNDRLLNGYKSFYTGKMVEPNDDYIQMLYEKQVGEYSKEAFDAFMKTADQYAPQDDIAPVSKAEYTAEAKTTKGGEVAGQKAMYKEAVQGESDKVAKILFEGQQTNKQKSAWKWAREHIFRKGAVFEDMALKTGNRELQAKFDNIRRAESRAQTFIGKGKGYAKALVDVRKTVEKAGKTEDFNYYLYHMHNVDRMTLEQRFKDVPNKSVFGDSVDAEVSRKAAMQLEILNPEFKGWAEDVYAINKHLRQMMVSEGIISQETADLWQTMYPHYVPISRADHKGLNVNIPLDTKRTGVNAPIKKAEGGNSDFYNVFDTMGSRIEQTYKAIAKNRFGVELMNTIGTAYESEAPDIDTVLENMDSHEELLQEGKNGESPSFTVFQNGERVKFAITEDMYDAMKPSQFTYTNEALRKINNIRRDILTTYSPTFALTNPIKDIQDILMNSQHPAKTYASIPEAIYSVMHKDQWYQERMENGGAQDSYFDGQTKTFKKEDGAFKKVAGWLPSKIQAVNEVIEQVPRMAEYIASRKMGRSIDVSMLDAARVTTNFGAAGDFTNMLNRNGFTFLGASIEGFNQQVRNVREAKAEGAKGWAKLAGKCVAAGLPAMLLNHLLWDDDEDYAELSDYVKQNYYVIAKTEEGKFIRIPKGRTVAVIQDAFQQMANLITGDDQVDLNSFAQLVINNLAPNNPLENNLIAPVYQAYTNKTWYGDDLVPTRLQKVPAAEQFDETTDSLSKWLGDATDTSPYKWNYLLDQYSGGVGDMILPYLTPEADGGGLGAAMRDKFVTDPVLKNQNVTDFYDTMDELTQNANSMFATDEDVLKNKYMSTINSQLSELYQKKRLVQGSDMSDAEKYAEVRDIQSQIVELTRNGLSTYGDVNIDGVYATIGDVHFRQNKGEWQKITDKQLEKQGEVTKGLDISPSEYWSDKDTYDFMYEYPDKYEFLKDNGVSYEDYANGNEEFKEAWTWAAKNPEKFTVSKAVADDVVTYRKYTGELYDIKADKDEYGKSISGSRKEKVIDYINGMDLDYGAKLILFKSEYEADDTYNYDIIEYLNGREDISYDEMETILKELGFHVDSEGNITWD